MAIMVGFVSGLTDMIIMSIDTSTSSENSKSGWTENK